MLAAALDTQERHDAEVVRRDELHVSETDRRDQLHVDEILRREKLHSHELAMIREAMDSRDLIGQAKGIIMSTMLCPSDEAFRLIRQQSMHENRKVVEIASEIVRRVANRAQPLSRPPASGPT